MINVKAQIFFAKMAQPLTGQKETATEYSEFLRERAAFLLPLIAEAIEILNARFGLTDPFLAEPSPGAA
jgi:hypothetical protein